MFYGQYQTRPPEDISCVELRSSTHRTRQDGKVVCKICKQPIRKGEWYRKWVGKIEGEFISETFHDHTYGD